MQKPNWVGRSPRGATPHVASSSALVLLVASSAIQAGGCFVCDSLARERERERERAKLLNNNVENRLQEMKTSFWCSHLSRFEYHLHSKWI
jgi:hypothetical protein